MLLGDGTRRIVGPAAAARDRTASQLALLDELPRRLDLEVLGSEEIWR